MTITETKTIREIEYRNDKGQLAGKFVDGVYYKVCDYEKHHLHKLHGWAVDISIIEDLQKRACLMIVIYTDSKKYQIPFSKFLEKKWEINFGTHGKQYVVSDKEWEEILLKK